MNKQMLFFTFCKMHEIEDDSFDILKVVAKLHRVSYHRSQKKNTNNVIDYFVSGEQIKNCMEMMKILYWHTFMRRLVQLSNYTFFSTNFFVLLQSKSLKSSTLWSSYSMLKSTLKLNENVDISVYSKLIAYLKRQNDNYVAKKSNILTADHVRKFLIEADDESFLFMKVVLIFALHGACRSEELRLLKIDDVEDSGSVLIVRLNCTKTKKKRTFTVISQIENVNELALYRRYLSLRPKNVDHRRLFIFYSKGKCTVQPVGINTFYSLPKKIAEYLKLPNASSYTGHCFRRSSATLLADSGADMRILKQHAGWRSTKVAEGYIEDSIANKIKISSKIVGQVKAGESSVGGSCVLSAAGGISERMSDSTAISDIQSFASSSGIIFSNLHNCTFNFCNDKLKE